MIRIEGSQLFRWFGLERHRALKTRDSGPPDDVFGVVISSRQVGFGVTGERWDSLVLALGKLVEIKDARHAVTGRGRSAYEEIPTGDTLGAPG